MDIVSDKKTLTDQDVIDIIDQEFSTASIGAQSGAGSFCKFVTFKDLKLALLTPKADTIVLGVIKKLMGVINNRDLPVDIFGAGTNIEKEGDYAIIMPEISGVQMPSNMFGVGKNIAFMSAVDKNLKQKANDEFIKECFDLNLTKRVSIDYHGANFFVEEGSGKVRMIDLKKFQEGKPAYIMKRLLRMSDYTQLSGFSNSEKRLKYCEEHGVDIDVMSAHRVIKTYTSLIRAGHKQSDVEATIAREFPKRDGRQASIDDFDKLV
jgi:hypothetical protein